MCAAIVVEDGSQVSGANSYISEAELSTYAADRGITITGTNAVLIILAMDYIEAQPFQGFKTLIGQTLQFPRTDVLIDCELLASDEIPTLLKDALAETALAVDRSQSPLADIDRAVKKEGAGAGLFTEYMDAASSTAIIRTIDAKLQKLLGSDANNGMSFSVSRG